MTQETTKKSRYLTLKQFQQEIIGWSQQTIRRRIRDEGLPAIEDSGGLLFDRVLVNEWFKKRTHKAG